MTGINLSSLAANIDSASESRRWARPLAPSAVRALSRRSDVRGSLLTLLHAVLLMGGGWAIAAADGALGLAAALIAQGVVVAALFAPLHEGVHYNAFRSRRLNEVVAWVAGAAIFWNAAHYRLAHYAHHRYTQDPQRDPELARPKPRTRAEYFLRLSGWPYWQDRARLTWQAACGDFAAMPYVPPAAQRAVTGSVQAMLALYGAVAVGAVAAGSIAPLLYWVIPGLLGQPVLRAVLLAEHSGCSEDANGLTNTRTTLTLWPVRLLYWNLPYHAEHHLYPSIPFHALPAAHRLIRHRLAMLGQGYVRVHRELFARLGPR